MRRPAEAACMIRVNERADVRAVVNGGVRHGARRSNHDVRGT